MAQPESSAAATYRRLLRYLRPHLWLVVAVFLPAVIYASLGTFVPLLMSQWIGALRDAAADRAWQIPLLIVVLFVGWIALNGGLKFGIISQDIDINLPF